MDQKRTPRRVDLAGPDAAQQQSKLEVHAFTTPNSIKVPIALEEILIRPAVVAAIAKTTVLAQ
jgi:hypothetical protein